MSDEKTIQPAPPPLPVPMGERGLDLRGLDEAWRFATGIIRGRMAPKGISEPGAVVAIIEAGMELGLPPMFALSNLTFINSRLGIMGDAAKALILSKGKLKPGTGIRTRYEGEGDEWRAIVSSHRAEEAEPVEHEFSVADAKTANLWKKAGPWTEYPKRMLMYRALGFHVRDQYPDVMMGAALSEELRDYPTNPKGRVERDVTPPKGKDPLLSLAARSAETPTVEDPPDGPEDGGGAEAPAASEEQSPSPSESPSEVVVEPAAPDPFAAKPSDNEPPPLGDADAPIMPELPLEDEGECPHLTVDGHNAWVRSGDHEICMKCNAMRFLTGETVRDKKGRL